MKKVLLILCVLLSTGLSAQKKKPLEKFVLNSTEFEHPVEISGLDIAGDSLYVLSENCKSLYHFNVKDLKEQTENLPLQKFHLAFMKDDVDLEGLALFKNFMFYTNEKGNTINAIDLKSNTSFDVQSGIENLPKNDDLDPAETGLEGIEVDNTRNLLYVIQEREKFLSTSVSKLVVYRIDSRRDKLELTYVDELDINLSEGCRYTALALSSDNKSIFMIRSKYIKSFSEGRYFIDKIDLESTGTFASNSINMTSINLYEIDNKVINNANLEGIAHYNNELYLVNDNLEGKEECSDSIDNPTHVYVFKDKN